MDASPENSEIVLLVFSLKEQVPEDASRKISDHLHSLGYRRKSGEGELPTNSWFGDLRFAKTAALIDVMDAEGQALISAFNRIGGNVEAVESMLFVGSRQIWWNAWGSNEPGSWSTEDDRQHSLSKYFCDAQPRKVRVPRA